MDEPTADARFRARLLVDEIGAITGEPKDILVLRALEERLRRLTAPITATERARRILNVLETSLWQNTPASKLGGSMPREADDKALGYGPEGV
jgi:hypothetical protein